MSVRRIMRKFRMSEISGVDRPAQVGARVAIMKCDSEYSDPRLLSDVKGHAHLIDVSRRAGSSSYEKMPKEEYWHTHPWITDVDGKITVGAANGHTHEVINSNSVSKSADGSKQGNSPMADQNQTTELETVTKQLAAVTAELALAKAIGELTDAQKAHYSKLNAGEQAAFTKASPAERQATVETLAKAATDSNPVVYTALNGDTFRKNDDPRLAKMAKEADDERKQRLAGEIRLERSALEKRAGDELNFSPGAVDVKVAVLKAIDGIADEAVRTGALALVKAGNDALNPAFVKLGTKTPAASDTKDPEAELDRLAKAHAAEHKVDFFTAYDAVSKLHPQLFAKAVGETVKPA